MRTVYHGHDVAQYKDKLERAIYRYGHPRGTYRPFSYGLDDHVDDKLGYMQPSAALYWQKYLHEALVAHDVYDRGDIWAITILDRRWHFGEREWRFKPQKIDHHVFGERHQPFAPRKIEYQVRRALKGLNYLVMIEFEVFGNLHHFEPLPQGNINEQVNRGRIIAPHIQGLIWGGKPSRQQRAQFLGGLSGSYGIKLMPVNNFAGAVRYMVKPPYMGRLVRPLPDGRYVRYPWERMPLLLHHLLFCNLYDYRFPDLTFGSGEGSAVLARAHQLWRDYDVVGLDRPSYPPPPFHALKLRRHRDPRARAH